MLDLLLGHRAIVKRKKRTPVTLTRASVQGEQALRASRTHINKFERGHTDVFDLECVDLGVLTKLRVWHNDHGVTASWFLDSVEVHEEDTTSKFVFPVNKWLSHERDDKATVHEVPCTHVDLKGRSTQYKITIAMAKEAPKHPVVCPCTLSQLDWLEMKQ